MKKAHYRKSNMVRNNENLGNEKCTVQDMDYGEKTEKHGK